MHAPRVTVTPLTTERVGVARDEVRVWVIPLDSPPAPGEELREHLTDEERSRADRYKVEKVRHQFVTGRGLLRRILGTQLGIPARAVPIAYTGAGKPVLADEMCGVHFNVTHTDTLALIALARCPVGIDTERVRALADPEGLVRRFFSPAECEAYLSLPVDLRPTGFFRAWTCKEAIIKTVGLSVTCLDGFDVELDPGRPAAVLAARHPALCGREWRLMAWEAAAGFAAAVALQTEDD